MKAVVCGSYGPPEVLHVKEVPAPEPGPDEVRIEVAAAEATKADCEMRSFRPPVYWYWVPLRLVFGITRPPRPILGAYFSGTVDALGKHVRGLSVGDEVFGSAGLHMGAYGRYVCLPAKSTIVPKPHNMSFEEAAAVPLGGLNALHFMRLANVRPGDHVLVNGAGGSIGAFGVQIAKAMGAEVTGVDAPHKHTMVSELGADHFIDYTQEDFTRGGPVYDVIFDMVVRSSYRGCIQALKPGGRYLIGNPRLSDMVRSKLTNRSGAKRVSFAFAKETREELNALKDMIERGEIRVALDRIVTPEQAPEAHRRVETEARSGAVVISFA